MRASPVCKARGRQERAGNGDSQHWDLQGFLGWGWCLCHLWSEGSAGWCLLIPAYILRHSVQGRGLQSPWEWEGDSGRGSVTLSVGG